MERLKHMKEMLMGCVEGEMTHLDRVDTKELGEAIDMIKDLAEAIYYCTITEAMEGKEKDEPKYYTPYRDMDRDWGKMYYDGAPAGGHGNGTRGYVDFEMRDTREGRSGMTRKGYMEAKEMHHNKEVKLKELEKYVKELSHDVVEMIEDASPEERQMLKQKMTALVNTIHD
jgi:hypothetical protein